MSDGKIEIQGRSLSTGLVATIDPERHTAADLCAAIVDNNPADAKLITMRSESDEYLRFIRARPCCNCGTAAPSEWVIPLGETSDFKAIPLCTACRGYYLDNGRLVDSLARLNFAPHHWFATSLRSTNTRIASIQLRLLVAWCEERAKEAG